MQSLKLCSGIKISAFLILIIAKSLSVKISRFASIHNLERIALALNVEIKEFFNFDGLKDVNYIKEEFKKMIKYSDEKHLQLLYKIHNDLIN